MVKNVRSSKSSSHLSLVDNSLLAVSGPQFPERLAQLSTDLNAFSVKIGQEGRWRVTEAAQGVQQKMDGRDTLLHSQGGRQGPTSSSVSGDANWNGKVAPLDRIDKPLEPQRMLGKSISVTSGKQNEAPSPALTTLDDGTHPELGMQWAGAKPKSLFEGFNEQAFSRREECLKTMHNWEQSLFQGAMEEPDLRRELEKETSIANKLEMQKVFSLKSPEEYTQPLCDFLTENPTVFHAVDYFEKRLEKAGYTKVCSLHLLVISKVMLNLYSSLNAKNGTSSQGGNTLSPETALL
jgi:hypothetical protein